MRWRTLVAYTVGGVLLAFLYYLLVAQVVGYSAALPRPSWWMNLSQVVGRRAVAYIWMEIPNTVAMSIAAVPAALVSVLVFRKHALALVVIAATAAAAYGLGQTSGVVSTSHVQLGAGFIAVLAADSLKMIVLPAVMVIALQYLRKTEDVGSQTA